MSPARRVALRALIDADEQRTFADRRLRELFDAENLSREDRALATLLVQETIRRRGSLDHRLSRMLEKGLGSVPAPVREALRMGLLQVLHLDRIPEHAAVDESVSLVRAIGQAPYTALVNAVLRRAARGDVPDLPDGDDDGALAARHSFPAWLIRRWRRLGERLESALAGSNRTPEIVLRVNRMRSSLDRVLRALAEAGVEAEPGRLRGEAVRVKGRLDLQTFPPFAAGEVSVQDESEALVVELVDPLPGYRVLDLCAAPGGKSTHVLERSDGRARLIAADVDLDRLRLVRRGLARLHLRADLVAGDARRPSFVSGRFERVLVDAPCTGTGVLARRAEARWRLVQDDPARCAERQLEILEAAGPLVSPGGVLAYSVCSIEPEETSGVVTQFLAGHPEFREEIVTTLPAVARDEAGRLFLLPGDEGCDGVFGVRFRRVE